MIKLSNAASTQLTHKDGSVGDWQVNMDGELLYTLTKDYTVPQTFQIVAVAEKMANYGYNIGKNAMQVAMQRKIDAIIANGDAKLDALKAENERLSEIMDKLITSEE